MTKKIIILCFTMILCLCGCATSESKTKQSGTSAPDDNGTVSSQKDALVLYDMIPVTSMEELWEISDFIIQGCVKSRTNQEIYDSIIEYKIEVNEWIKGEHQDENEILLKVLNNETGKYAGEYRYYDFGVEDTYIFFINFDENTNRYWLSCQSTGVIKVEADNKVQAHEFDMVFKDCQTYDDVLEIINRQKE